MNDDRSNLGDASSHYGLDHSWRRKPKLRAGEMDENLKPLVDEKGRAEVILPDQDLDSDPELHGKSPDEILEILERRKAKAEANPDLDKMMRDYPGKPTDGSQRSSSGGSKSPKKPRPPTDHTKQSYREPEGPTESRPHGIAGKVTTHARHGLYAAGVSIGEMMDELGKTLHKGIAWTVIAEALRKLREGDA